MVKIKRKPRPITIRIKFLVSCGDGEFEKGDVKELNAASAHHWMKRGLAEPYDGPIKKKPGRPPKKEEEPKVEEKKTEDFLRMPSSRPPITVTDPTPEIERAPILEAEKE